MRNLKWPETWAPLTLLEARKYTLPYPTPQHTPTWGIRLVEEVAVVVVEQVRMLVTERVD